VNSTASRFLINIWIFLLFPKLEVQSSDTIEVCKVEFPPKLDGKLNDLCWKNLEIASGFRQRRPNEGEPATEKTEVKLCRDESNLYVGVRCYDSEPEQIRAGVMQRDAPVRGDDYFFILIDPFRRNREGFYFRTNANGAKGEALVSSDMSGPKMDWDTIWDVRSHKDEIGWTAEFAIPFRSLPFDPSSDIWRIDFGRWFSRGQERSKWVGYSRNRNWFSLEDAGEINGLLGVETGKGIDFKPYFSAQWISGDSSGNEHLETGFDLFYDLTPSLTATLTYNTDFAETEVDQQRVNLSRFPLFFPEKRDFFLEGSDQFAFGGMRGGPLPFHSRTIGLSPDGNKIDLTAGAKINGRLGPLGVGLLGMGLSDYRELDSDLVVAGRLTYDLFEESKFGTIFTYGDPQSNLDNELLGMDLNLRSSNWWREQSLSLHTFYMATNDENKSSDHVLGTRLTLPNYPFRAGGHWLHTGENFEPALGFVRRRGIRSVGINFSYSFEQMQSEWMEDYTLAADYDRYDLENGGVDSEEVELKVVGVKTRAGDSLVVEIEFEREILRESFEIIEGLFIPAQEYRGMDVGFYAGASSDRPLFGSVNLKYGSFYDGTSTRGGIDLSWRPSKHFQLDMEMNLTMAELSEDHFDVLTSMLGFRITPSTQISFNGIAQYDNQTKTIGVNARTRYIIKSGSDLFLVLNKGFERENEGDRRSFRSTETEAVAKLGWTFQF